MAAPRDQAGSDATEIGTAQGTPDRQYGAGNISFLLTQLGTHAAARFAERIAALDLSPPQAGILRAIAVESGRSQQALGEQLGLLPSRVVAFVDDLEQRGYVERHRNPSDRRLYALQLTGHGRQLMTEIGNISKAHEDEITSSLTTARRTALAETLQALAAANGLTTGIHPGYKSLGRTGTQDGNAG